MSTVIKVASYNIRKMIAIRRAFERYFDEVIVQGFDVSSDVPSQPVNDDVMKGAIKRLENLKAITRDYDFLVSCEGGVICQGGKWFNQHIVLIENKAGKQSFGLSPSFPIPKKYIEEVKATSIAKTLDRIFEGKGGIRKLTRGAYTREKLVEEGTIMALTGFLNEEIW